MFTYDEIKELVKLVSESELGEIEVISANGDSIKIKGKNTPPPPPMPMMPPATGCQNTNTDANTINTIAEKAPEAEKKDTGKPVKSPIVGTFYRAADPSSDPFVKPGDTVKKGDVICIIEAMKMMNEVKAEFDGTVRDILVADGEAVEYDQTIMIFD